MKKRILKKSMAKRISINKLSSKFIPVFISISLLLAVSVLIFVLYFEEQRNYQIVATVNGDTIVLEEFRKKLVENSAGIYQYFKEKYGIDDSKDFWTTAHNGEIPIDVVREKSLGDLVRVKVQQQMAKAHGLQISISYRDFIDDLERENKSRKEAVDDGRVVYGKKIYSYNEYFIYVLNNMQIKLKDMLIGKELMVTEQEIEDRYMEVRNEKFKDVSYDDVKSNIETELLNMKYNQLIQKLSIQAEVEINRKTYKSIFVR